MPSSDKQQKLINLLRELFQLNQPDLDFGLYRIMHAKSREIEKFLNEDLLATIQQRLGGNKAEKVEKARAAYESKRQSLIADNHPNPDAADSLKLLKAEYELVQQSADDDEDLYEQLYRFFERYYDSGISFRAATTGGKPARKARRMPCLTMAARYICTGRIRISITSRPRRAFGSSALTWRKPS